MVLAFCFAMRDFAESFYKSKRWQANRDAYARSVGGLCEACARQGLVIPGEIVHHKIELTPENINDPAITMDWANLELVCRDCHALRHSKRRRRRYTVDAQGNVTACEAPPVSPSAQALGDRCKGDRFCSPAGGRGVSSRGSERERDGRS